MKSSSFAKVGVLVVVAGLSLVGGGARAADAADCVLPIGCPAPLPPLPPILPPLPPLLPPAPGDPGTTPPPTGQPAPATPAEQPASPAPPEGDQGAKAPTRPPNGAAAAFTVAVQFKVVKRSITLRVTTQAPARLVVTLQRGTKSVLLRRYSKLARQRRVTFTVPKRVLAGRYVLRVTALGPASAKATAVRGVRF